LVELLEQSGRSFTMFGTADPLHYVEVLLQPGDELIAVGRASLEVDEAGRAASPRGLPLRCHLRGGAETVVISDTEVT